MTQRMDPWHREDSLNADVQSTTEAGVLKTSESFAGGALRPWHQTLPNYMLATLRSQKVDLLKPEHLQGMPYPLDGVWAHEPLWLRGRT